MPKPKSLAQTSKDEGLSVEDLYHLWSSDYVLAAYHILNVEFFLFQRVILRACQSHPFCMMIASRGMGKSFVIAVYACIAAILKPGVKIGIIAPTYRQSKFIFERIQMFWFNSPVFQNECDSKPSFAMDKCYLKFKNGSRIEAMPLGEGDTIRGARYQEMIVDEWIHIRQSIMDEVVLPMLNVPTDPMMQSKIWQDAYRRFQSGTDPFMDASYAQANKMIMASTAYYKFHPSYKIYEEWCELDKRDPKYKVLTMNYLNCPIYTKCKKCGFMTDEYPVLNTERKMCCKQCGAPEQDLDFGGYMNMDIIHHQMRATPTSVFLCENLSVWVDDSGGFFKASHINKATPQIGQAGAFYPQLDAVPNAKYVLGIDPGRDRSNFGMVVLEVGKTISKVVWCRGIGKDEYTQADAFGEMDRFIRDLHRRFHFSAIGIDKGGGGASLRDLLLRPSTHVAGDGQIVVDPPLLEVRGSNKTHDEIKHGERIIYMINFTNQWINETAQSLRHSLEMKEMLFPVMPVEKNWEEKNIELEDIYTEVNDMAEELISIKTTVLPKLTSYLKFEPHSENALIDRAMALMIAHYTAQQVRSNELLDEQKPQIYAGDITGGSIIVSPTESNSGYYRSSHDMGISAEIHRPQPKSSIREDMFDSMAIGGE